MGPYSLAPREEWSLNGTAQHKVGGKGLSRLQFPLAAFQEEHFLFGIPVCGDAPSYSVDFAKRKVRPK